MDDLPSTILYPNAFRNSLSAGNDGVFDWSRWQAAIGTRGIAPMDIDASVEINNFFLWAETKNEEVPISRGQQRALDAAVQTGLVTVIYQWGKIVPIRWKIHTFNKKTPDFSQENMCPWLAGSTVADQIAAFIRKWTDHHLMLDQNAWRRRLIEAAFRNTPLGSLK